MECSPADGITAASNKRDSAFPLTALRLGYIISAEGATAAFVKVSDAGRSDVRAERMSRQRVLTAPALS